MIESKVLLKPLFCRSAAKVNLTLDVLRLRDDGYHELQSVVHTIGLWDELRFELDESRAFSLRCNEASLQSDDNLCLKAARAWLEAAQQTKSALDWRGTAITLQKNIPSGAGVGGGSGNAAATLLALNFLHESPLDNAALHALAARLGADVPLFLRGGCALMEGIGERLTPLPSLQGWLLLVQPPQRVGTPQAYRTWDALAQASARRSEEMRRIIEKSVESTLSDASDTLTRIVLTRVAGALHNDLHAAAQALGVDVESAITLLRDAGALGAAMTGSGSAVFGLFHNESAARAAAEKVAAQPRFARDGWHLWRAPFCDRGVQLTQQEHDDGGRT